MNRDFVEMLSALFEAGAELMGLPPARIDLLTGISGVTFDEAWPTRITAVVAGLAVPFIGRAELIRNKRAAARPKDLADVAALEAGETE